VEVAAARRAERDAAWAGAGLKWRMPAWYEIFVNQFQYEIKKKTAKVILGSRVLLVPKNID